METHTHMMNFSSIELHDVFASHFLEVLNFFNDGLYIFRVFVEE